MDNIGSNIVIGWDGGDGITVEINAHNLAGIEVDPISRLYEVKVVEATCWNIQLCFNLLAVFSISKANIEVADVSGL